MPSRHEATNGELPLLVVGTDHHHAQLELRGRVAYDSRECEDVLVSLIAKHVRIQQIVVTGHQGLAQLFQARVVKARIA